MITRRIYTPNEAVREAYKLILSKGFVRVGGLKASSLYVRTLGSLEKVRISDHKGFDNCDVVYSITFDYPTIIDDIKQKVDQAAAFYLKRNKVKRNA